LPKVLFIFSGNLSTTPRGTKVIDLLKSDYDVQIICVNRSEKWFQEDLKFIKENKLNVDFINLFRRPFLTWLITHFKQKIALSFYPFFKNSIKVSAYASDKSCILLTSLIFGNKSYREVDMILGFGAGALYPVYKMGETLKKPTYFDVEDFHPGESIVRDVKNEKKRRELLYKKLLHKLDYITFASPLIQDFTLKLISSTLNSNVILNSFPKNDFVQQNKTVECTNIQTVKIVWFGQKISFGRGLEEFTNALVELNKQNNKIEIYFIGEMDIQFRKEVLTPKEILLDPKNIYFKFLPIQKQLNLHQMLSDFHIGLALEKNQSDLNRQLCLTNKIIAYAQAGLCILASDTLAQKSFLEEFPEMGFVTGQSSKNMKINIENILLQIDKINEESLKRMKKSESFSWERESVKLMNSIKKL
jgi:hypothetical protein